SLPNWSTTVLSRVTGSGGENCQCSTASPTAVAQNASCATRKSPLGLGWVSAPDAKAMLPGLVGCPRNVQVPGPLHTSFWSMESKPDVSGVSVLVITPQPPEPTNTFCSSELVNVR